MAHYSIKDLELLSGVKAHTLRIWEQRYDFLKPHRTDTNIRYYTDEELKNVLNISLLNRHGLKISRIAHLSPEDISRKVMEISLQKQEPDVMLDALIRSMIEFDEGRFEKVLSQGIMKHGFERTFSEIIFPFMVRTGVLWSTGSIKPAQEHFVSNLVRRKLCVAVDNLYVEPNANSKRFVLFLPEGETHELLLLYTEYMLRKNNHEVAYIGTSLPYEDIDFVNQAFRPDYLVSYFTVPTKDLPLQEYINKLSASYPEKTILIGGGLVESQQPVLPHNVKHVRSLNDLLMAIGR
jgi:DNA-binding transcriptional MerR regulator